jgi:hypothetical protein
MATPFAHKTIPKQKPLLFIKTGSGHLAGVLP